MKSYLNVSLIKFLDNQYYFSILISLNFYNIGIIKYQKIKKVIFPEF